jgi:hypothetical protein
LTAGSVKPTFISGDASTPVPATIRRGAQADAFDATAYRRRLPFVRSLHEAFVPVDGPVVVPVRTMDARTPHHVLSVQSRRQNRLDSRNLLRFDRGKANLCV